MRMRAEERSIFGILRLQFHSFRDRGRLDLDDVRCTVNSATFLG